MNVASEVKAGSIFGVYCLRRLANKSYVLLNRFYHPVGVAAAGFVDYRQFSVELKISTGMAARLSVDKLGFKPCTTTPGDSVLWLYSDADNPFRRLSEDPAIRAAMKQAEARQSLLMSLTIRTYRSI